jgi:parafibromin
MSSADPLDLFRKSVAADKPAILLTAASEPCDTLQLAAYVSFPLTSPATNFTKDTSTRYTSKADSKDDFYNIGQIWLAWTERDAGVRDYLMKGQQGEIGYVGIADRRGVVEYLRGESDGGGRIASSTKAQGELQPIRESKDLS